jgi:chromosome segregation ATPase
VQRLVDLEAQVAIHKAYVDANDVKIRDLQSESELLLLQLHQVQEELESVFLKEQETQAEIERLKEIKVKLDAAIATLEAEQAKLLSEKTVLNDMISTLIRDKGALNQETQRSRKSLMKRSSFSTRGRPRSIACHPSWTAR